MQKFAVKHLPKVIHKKEHIKAVVYGRYKEKDGPSFSEGLLVATNLKILFLDHKPGYTKTEEITYGIVSGVNQTTAVFSAVTLRTRLGDYSIRFANAKCTANFVRYVENRRLEKANGSNKSTSHA